MNAPNAAGPDHDRKVADLLMLKEAPILAGVVTIVAQPFAQIRETYHLTLPDWLPLFVAAAVSALLALYYVRTVKRLPAEESIFLIPLLILILFSGSIGANNLVDASRSAAGPETVKAFEAREADLRLQLKNVERQLLNEVERAQLLRKALGLEEPKKLSQAATPETGFARRAEAVLGLFVGDAIGEPARPAGSPRGNGATTQAVRQNDELLRQLDELDKRQRELKVEQEKLKEKEKSEVKTSSRPLWKSW